MNLTSLEFSSRNAPHQFEQTNFGGSDYDAERDRLRMAGAMQAVFDVMVKYQDTDLSLQEIATLSGEPQSSVGSYLCYLRRDYGYQVPKTYAGNGLYLYRLGKRGNPKKKVDNAKEVARLKSVIEQAAMLIIQAREDEAYNLLVGEI